ncbi:unnamed protein product [Adineta ricciae]|uniref:Cardiolipin synthase N-terminal domain-containing protein n=1 Tax=Adineta ricciae TaxID=249248 RepID=A0A814QFJ7_ADIRI|nr:unnamed protein product [Adineta ricciae]
MASSLSVPLSIIFVSFLYILPFVAADRAIELGGGIGGGIAGLIILILDIIAIVDVLKSDRSIAGKLLWVLVIVLFPIGGLILWCLCGRKTANIV